jgi:hypothetical protein
MTIPGFCSAGGGGSSSSPASCPGLIIRQMRVPLRPHFKHINRGKKSAELSEAVIADCNMANR